MSNYRIDPQCVDCILEKFINKAPEDVDVETVMDYKLGVLKIIAEQGQNLTAPEIVASITDFKSKMFGKIDDFYDVKIKFNELMLQKESTMEKAIKDSADPFKTALKTAMLGNYIDFGAMYSVSEEKLDELLQSVEDIKLDETEYQNLCQELKTAKSMVLCTDNCGEIVADKLLVKQIKKQFPNVNITVIVRGSAVLNDATMEDARQVGLCDVTKVIGNGTGVAGTVIDCLSDEAKAVFNSADVIISKGQGNFETLVHCNRNVYYLFLCKCNYFAEKFNKPRLTGMFLNDRRLNENI